MAHGITEKDTAWFFNKPAWHGLGTVSKTRPKTTREWFKQAGIDWGVQKDELVTIGSLERILKGRSDLSAKQLLALAREFALPDWRATTRDDTHDVLGVVGEGYEPFANLECADFLDALLGSTIPETAFSLWGGKQVGALTRIPKYVEVGGDEVRSYIYLRTRHDGTGALWVWPTNVRVVCANTDRAAIQEAGGPQGPIIHKIRHRGDKTNAIHEARQALQVTIDAGKQFKKFGDRMAKQKVAERQLKAVMDELYPTGDSIAMTRRQQATRERSKETVRELFLTGDTVGNAPGSKWCLYQALLEHDQHHRSVRSRDERVASERRFVRAFEDPEGFGKRALAAVVAA